MEVLIRDQERGDIGAIATLWLAALAETDLEGQIVHVDAERRLRAWLLDRVRDRAALGLVADADGRFAGFLLGRVGEWDASPPILRPQRMGLIDVVCVVASDRRRGIGSRLVQEALGRMAAKGAMRIETAYQLADGPAARLWTRMDFRPSLQRAWRPSDFEGS